MFTCRIVETDQNMHVSQTPLERRGRHQSSCGHAGEVRTRGVRMHRAGRASACHGDWQIRNRGAAVGGKLGFDRHSSLVHTCIRVVRPTEFVGVTHLEVDCGPDKAYTQLSDAQAPTPSTPPNSSDPTIPDQRTKQFRRQGSWRPGVGDRRNGPRDSTLPLGQHG